MKDIRLTWDEIQQKYPHQNVGLVDVEYTNGYGSAIRRAIVVCTDKEIDRDEIAWKAINGELVMRYTTPDEYPFVNYMQEV